MGLNSIPGGKIKTKYAILGNLKIMSKQITKKISTKHPLSSNNFEPETDGIDHINIYSKGKTKLGKLLSNFANTPFCYQATTYKSLEGALYYYRTGDIRLVTMYGNAAKKLGRSLTQKRVETPALLKAWLYAKLYANPEIIDLLLNNSMPFSHYYVMYGRKIDADISLAELWREITNMIKYQQT
jgi:hypothetical protein